MASEPAQTLETSHRETFSVLVLRFSGPSALAAAGQAMGLAQLGLLASGGLGRQTDAYFFLATWILIPGQMLTAGMLYPVWIRGSAVKRRSEFFWLATVPAVSALSAVVAAFVFNHLTGGYKTFWVDAGLASIWGAAAATVLGRTLKQSSLGNPVWLAASNLIPNFFGCLVLVLFLTTGSGSLLVTGLLAAQASGCLVYLAVVWVKAATPQVFRPGTPVGVLSGAGRWFFLQAIVGYGAILAVQTQAATLAAAALSIVGLVSRVTSALNNLVTNAVLPRLIHVGSTDAVPVVTYLQRTTYATLAAGAVNLVAFGLGFGRTFIVAAAITTAWFCACTVNMGMKRLAARQLNPRISAISAALNFAVPVVMLVFTATGELNVAIVLIGLVLLDFLPGLALTIVTRRFQLSVFCLLAVGLSSGVAVMGVLM